MRKILKHFVIDTMALYFVSVGVSGIGFSEGLRTILMAGGVLTVGAMVVKPVINILLLPLNLVTFGLFKWVAFAVTLFIVTLVVPGFTVGSFNFGGYDSYWVALPPLVLSGILAFLAFSFLISFVSSLIHWIFK